VDTDVAVALCQGLAARRQDVLVAPALPYGSSGEHAGFPGTLSIGQEALELVVVELARSATDTVHRVLFVSGHGGNAEPLSRAVARVRSEGRDVRWFAPAWSGDAHAGRAETGLALALDPARVQLELAMAGDVRPLTTLLPELRAGGVRAVSPSVVLGDPRGADADEGHALLARLVDDLSAAVAGWWP
jgi:creatinine amidohydrolase